MGDHSKSSHAPSSLGVEEGDMQMHLLGKNTALDSGFATEQKHTASQTCVDQPFCNGTDTLNIFLFLFFCFLARKNTSANFIGQ